MATFIVQTKTHYTQDVKEQYFELARNAFEIFKKQPGFVSAKPFISEDDTHTMTIIEWQTKADHEACMASPDFTEFNATWEKLMHSGAIKFELNCYNHFQ